MTSVPRPRPQVGPDEFSARSMPIISIDTHIGPRLVEDLRRYCPKDHLDLFDAYAAATLEARKEEPPRGCFARGRTAFIDQHKLNMRTDCHHHMSARLV